MAEYRVYVDDSGTREYDTSRNYLTSGKSRYFAYGAILATSREASLLASRFLAAKLDMLGADVEVKSNWLRMPQERTSRYLEPLGITEDRLTAFVDATYALIRGADIQLIASIVDKLHMQQTYIQPWYAPTVAYEVLLQRVMKTVPADSVVGVTVDDIGGRTPKRNEYKTLLGQHHSRLKRDGSRLLQNIPGANISFAPLVEPVRFVNSAHSHLIQLADLVSYNAHRQFRDHGEAWETPVGGDLPMYEHFARIAGKFVSDSDGRVQGFGIVKFPLRTRVPWRIRKDAAP